MVATAPSRLVGIDALRGVAAFAVMLCHTLRLELDHYQGPLRWLGLAFGWGFVGVYLFFVISGFCIHLRWARQRAEGVENPQIDFVGFWRRRIRRLYPAYIVAFAIYVLLGLAFGQLQAGQHLLFDSGVHVLMLHNLFPSTVYSIDVVLWTLAVEEQLYLLYFLFLFLRRRFGWGRILGLALAGRVAWYALGVAVHRLTGKQFVVDEAAIALWFCWLLGALAVETSLGLVRLPAAASNPWVGAGVLAAGAALHQMIKVVGPVSLVGKAIPLVVQPILALGFFCIVNRVAAIEPWLRMRRRGLVPMLAGLGFFSYSLYLTHDLILYRLATWLRPQLGWSSDRYGLFTMALLAPAAVVFARIYFHFLERPFLSERAKVT